MGINPVNKMMRDEHDTLSQLYLKQSGGGILSTDPANVTVTVAVDAEGVLRKRTEKIVCKRNDQRLPFHILQMDLLLITQMVIRRNGKQRFLHREQCALNITEQGIQIIARREGNVR